MNQANCDYKVLIEGSAPESVVGGNFKVTFYSSNNPNKN